MARNGWSAWGEIRTEARRFLLPSGLRLVPIETVAAVVEVKLSLTREEFEAADKAATQTAQLRLAVERQVVEPEGAGNISWEAGEVRKFNAERAKEGVPLSDPVFQWRTTFALIGVEGIKKVETLAEWLREAKTISAIACLESGCVWGYTKHTLENSCTIAQREDALMAFAGIIRNAITSHQDSCARYAMAGSPYAEPSTLTYWDKSRYEFPSWYTPSAEEVELRAQLPPNKKWRK